MCAPCRCYTALELSLSMSVAQARFSDKVRILRQLGKLLVIVFLIATALPARNRKGESYLQKGAVLEAKKEWDKALELYEQAYAADPRDPAYQLAMRRVRFQAAAAHLDAGHKLRNQGKLEEALAEFQKAYATDPSVTMAEQEYRRTRDMIEAEKKKGVTGTGEERGMTPAQQYQKSSDEKMSTILDAPELKPINHQINTLKMNNQPIKVLFETVGKLAGINVVFDPELQPVPGGKSQFTVDLSNTSLEEALDFLSIQTKTFWKPLSPNTIFVTNDNVTKRRDYEDNVIKVFYVKNATTVQQLQEMQVTVRSVTEIRRAFVYAAQNAILMRGTPDQMALAEKLIRDLDKPVAEVVVDIIVMEADRNKTRDLAATFTTSGAPGLNIPVSYTGTAATTPAAGGGSTPATPSSSVALNALKNLGVGDFSIPVPGALLEALLGDSTTRVLQQPQLRAVENSKAELKIGDRIPYATGSFGSALGASVGAGVSPLVSTQFSFADVGVNVTLTPKVHGREEVSMQIDMEISNKSSDVTIGGVTQPIISQRKVSHSIRVREGEITLLGGLMQLQDARTISGVPGLANLPIFGPLFSSHHDQRTSQELLIALIPHIVRAPDYSETNLRGMDVGTDQVIKLNYSHPKDQMPPPPAPAAPPAPATEPPPAAPAPGAAAPQASATTPPAASAPASAPAGPPAAPPTPAEAAALNPAPLPGSTTRLFFSPNTAQGSVSSIIATSLNLENVENLASAPMKIKFDPKVVKLNKISQGNMMNMDLQPVTFNENTKNDTGESTITFSRPPGLPGVNGSGPLLTFVFEAVGKGTTMVSVTDLSMTTHRKQPIHVQPPSFRIVVE
jgi:general secretion pathway protein D